MANQIPTLSLVKKVSGLVATGYFGLYICIIINIMQTYYQYTKYFKPSPFYDERFTGRFIKNYSKFISDVNQIPPEFTDFSHIEWAYPYPFPIKDDLYNILYIISKSLRVKLMWRTFVKGDGPFTEEGFYVIGEKTRIGLWQYVVDFYLNAIKTYGDWLKVAHYGKSKVKGYKDIRVYVREKVNEEMKLVYDTINNQIEWDEAYERRLENYIMGRYKLDYKNYGQSTSLYYNAVSREFHHKRMML